MIKKLRLFPLAIIIMSMVLGIKIVDFSFGLGSSLAVASEPEGADASQNEPDATEGEGEADTDEVSRRITPQQLSSIPTRKEIEYLQKLSKRREELNRRARGMDDREKLLEAVELRIIERTNSLKKIEATIEGLLKKHDAREKAQIGSLVKIYSAMKPKEAALIFNKLDEEVLISIVENMKEKTMGKILAKMDISRAKKLTINLAERTKLPRIEG